MISVVCGLGSIVPVRPALLLRPQAWPTCSTRECQLLYFRMAPRYGSCASEWSGDGRGPLRVQAPFCPTLGCVPSGVRAKRRPLRGARRGGACIPAIGRDEAGARAIGWGGTHTLTIGRGGARSPAFWSGFDLCPKGSGEAEFLPHPSGGPGLVLGPPRRDWASFAGFVTRAWPHFKSLGWLPRPY